MTSRLPRAANRPHHRPTGVGFIAPLTRLRVAAVLTVTAPAALVAQDDPRPLPDSSVVVRDAVEAQRDFERLRRWLLPRATQRGTSGRMERIGRFRYYHDDDDVARGPRAEDRDVVEGRTRLITFLDSLRTRHPTSEWLAGQVVRYLVEAGRMDEARGAAESCRASRWWCLMLRGFVAHLSQQYDVADSLFGLGLQAMPEAERCTWTDLSSLLTGAAAGQYRDGSCSDREALNDRLFWLADPFYAVPGNDRRTEHFARNVVDRFYRQTETPHGLRWGDDYRELVLRFGWSEWWEAELRDGGVGDPSVIGHERPGGRPFLPPPAVAVAPEAPGWDDWLLDDARARERYAVAYARRFQRLDPQVAVFHRGDRVVVVAATEMPRPPTDTAPGPTVGQTALVLAPAPDRMAIVRDRRTATVSRLALVAPVHSGILSLEALDLGHGIAARRRFWLEVPAIDPGSLALSDLLLVDPARPLPSTLDAAIDGALPSTTVTAGDPVHVFWEVYGAGGRLVPFTLTVVKEDRGFLQRAVEAMGLAEPDRPTVRMLWEQPITDPREGLAIAVQLPEGETGSFTLRLHVVDDSGRTVSTERRIQISQDTER